MKPRARGATLVEVLVAAGLFSMIMLAVLSFYVEAGAVSAKKDRQSDRLRRFHLGLDKMEQMLREGRVAVMTLRTVTFFKLSDEIPELDGFPNYDPAPAQFVSTEEGVVFLQDQVKKSILDARPGEHVLFQWVQENPPDRSQQYVMSIELYFDGKGEGRSDLFFQRCINVQRY